MSKKFMDKMTTSDGTSNKKVDTDIGRFLLEQMSWKDGEGLGKDSSGIKDCVQIKRKNESEGLGFQNINQKKVDDRWWENIYNKNIKKLQKSIKRKQSKDSINLSTSNYDSEDEDLFKEFSKIVNK